MNISLYWSALKADIDQWTYRLASSIEDPVIRDDATSDSLGFSLTFWRRNVEDGVAALKVIISEKSGKSTADASDVLAAPDSSLKWDFTIDIQEDSSAMAEIMHRYVLMYALKSWASTYSSSLLGQFSDACDAAEACINELAYKRRPPVKAR